MMYSVFAVFFSSHLGSELQALWYLIIAAIVPLRSVHWGSELLSPWALTPLVSHKLGLPSLRRRLLCSVPK